MSTDSTELTAEMRSELVSYPLWEFALSLYARPGVEAACLRLQDEAGLDVCELLWLCWLTRHGLVPAGDIEQHLAPVRAWQRDMTYPLRRQRRALKALVDSVPDLARLRQTIKQAELLAEQQALRRLQDLACQSLSVRPRKLADGLWPNDVVNQALSRASAVKNDLDILATQLHSA